MIMNDPRLRKHPELFEAKIPTSWVAPELLEAWAADWQKWVKLKGRESFGSKNSDAVYLHTYSQYSDCTQMVLVSGWSNPVPQKQVGLGLHRAYIFTKQDLHPYLVHFSPHAVSIKLYIFFCVYQHKIVYVLVPLWYFKAPSLSCLARK